MDTISPLIFQNDSLLRLINSSVDNISALDTSSQRRIIQDYPYFVASYVILQLVSSLLGTVSNVLNICTFASMGFQDAVTIYLFALVSTVTFVGHHSGYAIPWMSWATHHDWHHYRFTEAFGTTGFLDRVMGTDRKFRTLKHGQEVR